VGKVVEDSLFPAMLVVGDGKVVVVMDWVKPMSNRCNH